MKARNLICALLPTFFLLACANPGQNRYMEAEVGKIQTITFGTIVTSREVEIQGESTGVGAALGATGGVGGVAAASTTVTGAVAAGIVAYAVGAMVEEQLQKRQGVEYIVTLETGLTVTLVQNLNQGDRVLAVGERVFVQNAGAYQRVLPASHLPTEVERPEGMTVVD